MQLMAFMDNLHNAYTCQGKLLGKQMAVVSEHNSTALAPFSLGY